MLNKVELRNLYSCNLLVFNNIISKKTSAGGHRPLLQGSPNRPPSMVFFSLFSALFRSKLTFFESVCRI